MADEFMTRFTALLAVPASTVAQWRELARELRPEHFAPVVALTARSNPATDQGLQRAVQTFAVTDVTFRDFLGNHAADSRNLAPNTPTFGSRLVLRALVEAARVSSGVAAPEVFRALAAHRAYNETVITPGLPSTLGLDIRTRLREQLALVSALSAREFVPAFCFVLVSTQKPLTTFAQDFDDRQFLLGLLHRLTDAATISALDWQEGLPLERQPLAILADSLAFVYNDQYPYDVSGQSEHFATGDAILRAIERCVQVWSASYAGWDVRPQVSRVEPVKCLRAEAFLRAVLDRLVTRNLPDNAKFGYFDGAGVALYQDWITLCGGYSKEQAEAFTAAQPAPADVPAPLPLWIRDWHTAERRSRELNLLPAVAPHAYVRWYDRLRIPDFQPPNDRRGPQGITDAALLADLGGEVWQTTLAQGLAHPFDLTTGDRLPDPVPSPAAPDGGGQPGADPVLHNALLTRMITTRGQRGAPLHPDHRRALRVMSAAVLTWRAEIAYRAAGPRAIVGGFSSSQARDISRARQLYQAALDLLGGEIPVGAADEDHFSTGLGLLGVVLDEERTVLRDECLMRLRQLGLGNDWAADRSEWPIQFLDGLNRAVESIIAEIRLLETSGVDAPAQQREREIEVQGRTLAVLQAGQLRDAAEDLAAAEQSTLEALQSEQSAAEVRVRIAQFRSQEARYLAAARRFAQDAQGDRQQAESALLVVEEETARQLEGQIRLLRENVEKLRSELPGLGQQIADAGHRLDEFKQTAEHEHEKKQSERAFISILKKIGSLVSIYFTGVDLVTIADTAIQAVKSAQSGDWAGAIMHARDAADLATGGKFSEALGKGLEQAERAIGSVMADSLDEAAAKIEGALGIDRTEALQGAIDAVSRQAFRIGVSFLARQTNTEAIALALGIGAPNPQVIDDLRQAAEAELLEGAWQAFRRRGENVVVELGRALNVGVVEDAIRQRLQDDVRAAVRAGDDANRLVVALVARIHERAPEADGVVAELKTAFLDARDRLVNRVSEQLHVEEPRVRAALDNLAGRALDATAAQNLPLPPVVLPAEVAGAIRDFRLKVETARGKIGFLTAPGKAEQLANQLAEMEDDDQFKQQLDRVTGQLQTAIGDAIDAMQQAQVDLGALEDKLGEAQVAQYKQQFKTQAQQFRVAEAASLAQSAGELVKAAGEATLAADQQIQVEEFALKVAGSRVAAQSAVLRARQNELAAAQTEIEIRTLALRKAENEQARWERLNSVPNPDQLRNLEVARLFYLEEANNLLVQSFQMLTLYEVDLQRLAAGATPRAGNPPPASFTPTFLTPTVDNIHAGKALMDLAEEEWNLKLVEQPRLLTTIRLDDIGTGLSDAVRDKLRPFFTVVEGDPLPGLRLTGKDLRRLKNGLTFRIMPFFNASRPLPADYPAFAPAEVYTDTVTVPGPQAAPGDGIRMRDERRVRAGLVVDFGAVAPWFDAGAFRVRLLGVVLKVTGRGGVQPGIPLVFYLRQEADCGIVVRDSSVPLERRYVPVPLPPVQDEDVRGRGVQLVSGPIVTPQWETRPLFGTYTLTIDDTVPIQDPSRFSAELHFVALGQPR